MSGIILAVLLLVILPIGLVLATYEWLQARNRSLHRSTQAHPHIHAGNVVRKGR